MATPDSSATSPSPPMAYFAQAALPPIDINLASVAHSISTERDDRKKAVEKFRERARLSSVTRALRARLAYASFKAAHNIPHVSLRDLEERSSNQTNAASSSRTIAAKRKAGVSTINAAGNNHSASSAQTSGMKKAVPPQPSSQRVNYYPTYNGAGSSITPNTATSSRVHVYPPSPASVPPYGQSLYASLLAPPPAKQARTIHNPSDPPPPAPIRQTNSPRSRPRADGRANTPVKSIAEGTRAHTKGRSRDGKPATPKPKRTPKGKSKRSGRRASGGTNDTDSVDGDGDVDMKAAAALTSLLLHNHRGSASISVGAGSASSPRSSIDGAASEAGSVASYAHYMQSSSRSFSDTAPSSQTMASESALLRPHTPVGSITSESRVTTTPRPDPTDNEAADLMLFLATSPSPARPSTNKERNSRDLAAFRTLSSNNDRPKGRILFPTAAPPGPILDDASRSSHPIGVAKPLTRGGTGDISFASSISSIGSYMGADGSPSRPTNVAPRSVPTNTSSSQLLPPPSLPAPRSPPEPKSANALQAAASRSQNPYPSSTAAVDFNFNDFINASPSPRASSKTSTSHFDPAGAPKPNLSLRADVGRKLFEEEQIRLGAMRGGLGPDGMGAQLGASIDLSS